MSESRSTLAYPESSRFGSTLSQLEEDVALLVRILPDELADPLLAQGDLERLTELVLDLGRLPEAVYLDRHISLSNQAVDRKTLQYLVERVGEFTSDNRAGIERTLHRISALRNRRGEIVGLTCRVGRAIRGAANPVRDAIESGHSLLLVGRPGVGKTTLLREAARLLADESGKRVLIVDTSNEIGGDGDIPHPGIGRARRLQVPTPDRQHAVMIEAVENHMPQVIVIDEIGTEAEARAARTIAERGVQLVATAHGNSLENLIANPMLCDLVGGIQAVTLSDEEARRRGTQKTVLERRTAPTFSLLIEILDPERLAVHHNVAQTVDRLLLGEPVSPELRRRDSSSPTGYRVDGTAVEGRPTRSELRFPPGGGTPRTVRIFPYGIPILRLERAIRELRVTAQVVHHPEEADCVLTLKSQARRLPRSLRNGTGRPVHLLRSSSPAQLEAFLEQWVDHANPPIQGNAALAEVHPSFAWVGTSANSVELAPRGQGIRRLQPERIVASGLDSASRGPDPHRQRVVFPQKEPSS